MTSPFDKFLGQNVKAPYRDGNQFRVARGTLESIEDGFVTITGSLGTLIINVQNIEKMGLLKERSDMHDFDNPDGKLGIFGETILK